MFCRINLNINTKKDALTVPLASLVKNSNSTGVFVINDHNSVFREIKEGMNDGKYVEVVSGLNPDDVVVTVGMSKLKDGTVVIVTNK